MKLRYNFKLAREEYKEDCKQLQKQLLDAGYVVDLISISYAWEHYSDDLCAGWLCLDKESSKNIINILNYLGEVE